MTEFAPARLQATKELPLGEGWLYEPKFDGYRGLLVNSAIGKASLWSRNDKDLGRWFPELIALAGRLPRNRARRRDRDAHTDRGELPRPAGPARVAGSRLARRVHRVRRAEMRR